MSAVAEAGYKEQDEMFVKWSKSVSDTTYDVAFMIEQLRQQGKPAPRILDIGGGIGTIATALVKNVPGAKVDVIDISTLAQENFVGTENTSFILGNFLNYDFEHKYDAILMRTLLHHLIDDTDRKTYDAQRRALKKTRELLTDDGHLYITENFYEPFGDGDLTGRLIFEVTKLQFVDKIVRKMGANTAGEGVRFRSWNTWEKMFQAEGLKIVTSLESENWGKTMPIWQKLPLLCKKRFQTIVKLEKQAAA